MSMFNLHQTHLVLRFALVQRIDIHGRATTRLHTIYRGPFGNCKGSTLLFRIANLSHCRHCSQGHLRFAELLCRSKAICPDTPSLPQWNSFPPLNSWPQQTPSQPKPLQLQSSLCASISHKDKGSLPPSCPTEIRQLLAFVGVTPVH